jgi:hypothetical protein
MGVEPAYPVTLNAVTVRTAYFEKEQLMCLPNDGENMQMAWAAIQTGTRRPET